MTNPTRQEIINAHEALNSLLKLASGTSTASAIFNWETVRAALPPKPRPTMADVEWDDDEHYLAEAEQNMYGNVIMLGVDDDNMNMIAFLVPPEFGTGIDAAFRQTLTPTGRRYTLTEVQE
ncbi:hypothetical protein I6J72_05545 [Corynebacterium sp. FDAARGOS 1242]|uniref:hypothetical protein n=1 Tax=Corynebacterium sp. FDAARGOS 1242 TaxID=2778078 RepID=UPI0019517BD0|nr:hypothetical protein [Corynebacterium sp. FDAARGOS 1242]QRP98964.1 hypothetical protein I6J72_05545 [Corynebacterium sp. FDAARGOS 1242]